MSNDSVIYPSNGDAVFVRGYLQRAMSPSDRFLCRERAILNAFLHSEG